MPVVVPLIGLFVSIHPALPAQQTAAPALGVIDQFH